MRVNKYLLQHLDRNKFDVYFLCPEAIVKECRKEVGNDNIVWRSFSSRFDLAVKTIREAQCDILYHWKVGGGTLDYFLAHAKLAPIQCTSYGTHGTSGSSDIDYFLTSSLLEDPNIAQEHYTETAVFLNSYATCHERNPITPVSRKDLDLPEQGALYFCPHRLAKYHPMFDEYLKRILTEDQQGHVILLTGKHRQLAESFSLRLKHHLGETLDKRVIRIPSLRHDKYRNFFSVVTCVLDSPVYAGDLTAHDAFEFGVPVVTQCGDLLVQRYTSGMYCMMQMESVVAKNREEYVKTAVRIGTDTDYREEISHRIKERSELVFDPQVCVPEYENFFERAVSEYPS